MSQKSSTKSSKSKGRPVPVKKPISKKPNETTGKKTTVGSLSASPTPSIKPCGAIRSPSDNHLQCLFMAVSGDKYCPLHLSYKTVTDYDQSEREISVEKNIVHTTPNPLFFSEVIESPKPRAAPSPKPSEPILTTKKKGKKTHKENEKKTIQEAHDKNEDILEVKFLIMMNDGNMIQRIETLVGPAFSDVTLCEDDQDPITLDKFWELRDGKKYPLVENKYYLFSYFDSKQKLRCLSVFTLFEMFNDNDFCHPLTMEPIGDEDIQRGKELLNIYSTRLGLFSAETLIETSPEYELKSKIDKLFKTFHVHSIFFESNWLMNIDSTAVLQTVMNNTRQIINNNVRSISNQKIKLQNFDVSSTKKMDQSAQLLAYKEHIFHMWDEIITKAANINNQTPIWIIACGMSNSVPEIKQKYPDIDMMLQ